MAEITEFKDKLYCDVTSQATNAISGKNILLCIFNDTGDKLLAIAGQQNLKINKEKEVIEINSKTTEGGWKTKVPGIKDWNMDVDGVYAPGDESQKALSKAFDNDEYLCCKVVNGKTKKALFGGLAILTKLGHEAPVDDSMTYEITLEGCGALADLTEVGEATAMPVGYETDKL